MLEQDPRDRDILWRSVFDAIEHYLHTIPERPVTPRLDPEGIRQNLAALDFERPMEPLAAIALAVRGLTEHQVHTPHPRYFGLFNPAPTTMGIAADTLVAAWNPQLAAWSHSPFAVEVEAHLVRCIGARFGYPIEQIEGTFAGGGAEANHTAILTALMTAFPRVAREGVGSLPGQPVLYVSAEAHHSFAKGARQSGLGSEAVRTIPVDTTLRMRPEALARAIEDDRRAGRLPFLIVGTAGTTGAGATDPLLDLALIAERGGLWFHVDAAWGGAAAFVPELRPVLDGIERADSITFDAHKLLSVPMGAGMYLTRRQGVLERTFRVSAAYMPRDADGLPVADPFATSMQWSRRFIGLKVFLSLLVAGWDGYRDTIRHQTEMGAKLRSRLVEEGWRVVNETPLPVVCFVDGRRPAADPARVLAHVLRSGAAWISVADLSHHGPALRACITNYKTEPRDVEALVTALGLARNEGAPA